MIEKVVHIPVIKVQEHEKQLTSWQFYLKGKKKFSASELI